MTKPAFLLSPLKREHLATLSEMSSLSQSCSEKVSKINLFLDKIWLCVNVPYRAIVIWFELVVRCTLGQPINVIGWQCLWVARDVMWRHFYARFLLAHQEDWQHVVMILKNYHTSYYKTMYWIELSFLFLGIISSC